MRDQAPRDRSAFLAALGVPDDSRQRALLQIRLEVLAHSRARATADGYGPVDVLVEFLCGAAVTAASEPLRAFRSWFLGALCRAGAGSGQSPRDTALQQVRQLFGRPAQELAEQLDQLLQECAESGAPLDSRAVRELCPEAAQLAEEWAFALDEDVERPGGAPRAHQQDEGYATEAVVLGAAPPGAPGAERLAVGGLVRESAELLALDRRGLVPWSDWNGRAPSLGWPVVLAQVQYRLRQDAVSSGDGDCPLVTAAPAGPCSAGPSAGGRATGPGGRCGCWTPTTVPPRA
ncbi:hypothetical protein GXW83_12545 [Streptacidiphilus sp. PB12-B1b]|uniref:hypothetical protein n=1 Tax=Streptacidiphilus sp. PB12-B1b TaxID=2705012 RepID=UPI0015F9C5AC|nr:hypothetical protein [Streptacidiphilus sp. PB12-B1b]QMU76445.1 hypothetical protein GXW83_12545 [Streptacidiphilus sp. PB12-B1b]